MISSGELFDKLIISTGSMLFRDTVEMDEFISNTDYVFLDGRKGASDDVSTSKTQVYRLQCVDTSVWSRI